MRPRRTGLLFVLVALGAAGLAAQAPVTSDPGEEVRYRLRTSVDLVLVPVTVKDSSGNLVTDLRREDFEVFEDEKQQQIKYFSADPFPLSAVILVDEVLSQAAQDSVRTALPVLAGAFSPQDEFALFAYDVYPRQVLDFTNDFDQLRQAFPRVLRASPPPAVGVSGGPMSAGPRINSVPVSPGVPNTVPKAGQPLKCLNDALWAAGMALRNREAGRRRVIFVVSDGDNSRLNVHKFEETRDLLLAENITVYFVGVDNARFKVGAPPVVYYVLATGGDRFAPLTEEGLASALSRVTEQARYQYTLVYTARVASGAREYRRIQVKVRHQGVKVLAREGYFAGLPTQ
ncbi:MAG TPA: VWA domain-containing protein [Candidatus Xenobia bacterium]|nr:VWA domain-containing protein [Candidatus Xenobia bacterium]